MRQLLRRHKDLLDASLLGGGCADGSVHDDTALAMALDEPAPYPYQWVLGRARHPALGMCRR